MKRIGYWFTWAIIGALLFIAAIICFTAFPSSDFRDNFLGDWFATIIGAVIGVPIALWLSRKQQQEQEEQARIAQEQEALNRKVKILNLIQAELSFNLDQLKASRVETNDVHQRVVFLNGLKDELWDAFSNGGELQWVNDLQLMHVISFAYHYIKREIYLEELYMELKRPKNWANAPAKELAGHLAGLDPIVIGAIEQALAKIENSLESLPELTSVT